MPIVRDEPLSPVLTPTPEPMQEPEGPPLGETFGAAFRTENTVGSFFSREGRSGAGFDPAFDPFAGLEERYQEHATSFAGANNEYDVAAIKRQIDREERDRQTLADAGGLGIVASITAGIVDPINFVPIGGTVYRGARTANIARSAIAVGAAGAAGAAIAEGALHATQETRTAEESAYNIAGAAVLAGVIGAGASAVLGRRYGGDGVGALQKAVSAEERQVMDVHAGKIEPGSVSAAHIRDVSDADLRLVAEPAVKAAARTPVFSTPDLRMRVSGSKEARLAAQELTESHLATRGNVEGARSASSVEADVRVATGGTVRTNILAREIYKDIQGDRPSWIEFKNLVGRAMRDGDSAAQLNVPESLKPSIENAARLYRERVFDPQKNAALDAEILTENQVEAISKTAKSYLTRLYNREKIRATRAQFRGVIEGGLRRLQADDMAARADAEGVKAQASQQLSAAVEQGRTVGKDAAAFIAEGRPLRGDVRRKAILEALEQEAEAAGSRMDDATKNRMQTLGNTVRQRKATPEIDQELQDLAIRELGFLPGDATDIGSQAARAVETMQKQVDALKKDAATLAKQAKKSGDEALAKKAKEVAEDAKRLDVVARQFAESTKKSARLYAQADRKINADGLANFEDQEITDIADEIINNILGDHSGKTVVNFDVGKRGPMKERVLTFIRDDEIVDWLENDIEKVAGAYTRTMAPDIALGKRYKTPTGKGDVTGAEVINRIEADYAQKIRKAEDAGDAKAVKRLAKEMKNDVADARGIIDRTRNIYWIPQTQNSIMLARGAHVAKGWQVMTKLGNIVLSSLGDVMRPVFVHGVIRTVGDGIVPVLTNAKVVKMVRGVAQEANTANDLATQSVAMRWFEAGSEFHPRDRVSRGIDLGVQVGFRIAGFDHFQQWNRNFTAIITQSRMIRAIEKWDAGKLKDGAEKARLARLGIGQTEAAKINAQLQKYGSDFRGTRWADPNAWDDATARDLYLKAVGQEIDETVIIPGQDKPFWLSTPVGSVLGQFWNFGIASMQRTTLAGIQRMAMGDVAVINGAIGLSLAGMFGYYLKSKVGGWDMPDPSTPEGLGEIVWNGVEQGGLLAYGSNVNRTIEAMSGGALGVRAMVGKPPFSKYRAGSQLTAMTGPSVGTLEDAAYITSAIANNDIDGQAIYRLRRNIPYNNALIFRRLFDEMENYSRETYGIAPRN